MKRITKTLLFVLTGVLLTSCDLFGKLIGGDKYKSYEEYFEKELHYQKFNDIAAFNTEVGNTSYFWTKNESEKYNNTTYYTGKSFMISVYNDKNDVYVYSNNGDKVEVSEKDGVVKIENTDVIIENGEKRRVSGASDIDNLDMVEDNDGYLVVAYKKFMFYVTKDFKNVYMNEKNTNVFQGYGDTKTIASSELLTNTLQVFGAEQRVQLPAPGESYEIWYGVDKNSKTGELSHGTAYIADVHPKDYVEKLKANGFTVTRSFEDPYYAFYEWDGGYWYCYDEKEELEIYVSLSHYLYISDLGKSYGPLNNTKIWFEHMNKGYFGEKERTKNETWDSSDLANMAEWYDGTIDASAVPFVKLGKGYSVPTKNNKSYARNGILDGTLAYHEQCYNIFDSSPYYFLGDYDEILKANGFHLYEPEHDGKKYDLTNSKDKADFHGFDESKYVYCYINSEKDIAIKYYFDITWGNTIRVFKASAMRSWLVDQEQ